MTDPVINIHQQQTHEFAPENSSRFGANMARMTSALGLEGIGCKFVTVQPGKRAYPFHNHLANDELFVILEGSGTYRLGDQEYSLAADDLCAAPRGGPDTAHQIINTGDAPLRYLAISTRNDPEIVEYPDSDKFAAIAIGSGSGFVDAHLRFIGRKENSMDYFEGEEL